MLAASPLVHGQKIPHVCARLSLDCQYARDDPSLLASEAVPQQFKGTILDPRIESLHENVNDAFAPEAQLPGHFATRRRIVADDNLFSLRDSPARAHLDIAFEATPADSSDRGAID